MSLFHLLNGRNYGVYNRAVAHQIGLHTTIFLSELLDKYQYFISRNETISIAGEEGTWFYITADDMEERTTLSEKSQRTCLDKLSEMGLIRKKISGLPAKRYFQVDEQKISDFLIKVNFTSSAKTPNLLPPLDETGSCGMPKSPIYKNPNEEPEEEILGAEAPKPPNLPSKRKRLNEPMIEVAPRVFLSASQQEALKKRLEASKITLDEAALHLSDWKVGKGITGGSNDYSAIIKWVIDAVTKQKQTFSDKGKSPVQEEVEREKKVKIHIENKKWLNEVSKRFQRHIETNVIRIFPDSIEFNVGDGGGRQRFDCASAGFRDSCLKYLRSLNLDTSGL